MTRSNSRSFARALRGSVALLGATTSMLFATALIARPANAANTTTVGEQSTVVLLVNYTDRQVQPFTREAANAMVFGEANDAYWAYSYGKMTLVGDTYGWFTVPVSASVCNPTLVAQEADKAATAAGIDLSKYDHKIYLGVDNSCSGAGYNSGVALPTRTSMFVDNMRAEYVVHEFGHNLGLSHAQSFDCGAVTLAADTSTCTVQSYGDTADVMGNGHLSHMNAASKEKLGWLTASGAQSIRTVTASGRYRIERFEDGTGTKALKIARATDPLTGQMNYYYVEYRQPVGHDAGLATVGNLATGVLLRTGGKDQASKLLDATPSSQSTEFDDGRDSAIPVGGTYRDDAAKVTVTIVSADTTGATVDVTIAAGAEPPPSSEPPPATGTLTDSVGTDKTVYAKSETVAMSALVKRDGIAVAGATVKFVIATPSGSTTVSATTGSDGYARGTYRIGKAKTAVGTYTVRADATNNGDTASASTSFSVR